ncbi:hypothetical protein BDV18DRAFT_40551 [Aspergillus unguis]
MTLWRSIVTLTLFISSLAHTVPRHGAACSSLNKRRSWNSLTNAEKSEYLEAERCLMHHPPVVGTAPGAQNVWDELQQAHISQGNYVHFVGHFLPWHRYLVRTHEVLLQTLCGYTGAQPYWDEVADYEAGPLKEASIFDPVFGFGGDGDGGDGCIRDGPFADTTLRMRGLTETHDDEYCLSRALNQSAFVWGQRSEVDRCFAMSEYRDAWACYNFNPHSAGHTAVGGVMVDAAQSNGDPLFYLHHAYIDRLWWQWQQADLPRRLSDMGGPNTPPLDVLTGAGLGPPGRALTDYNGDEGGETTLAHVLWVNGIQPNVTVADVMDLGGNVVCAEYQ